MVIIRSGSGVGDLCEPLDFALCFCDRPHLYSWSAVRQHLVTEMVYLRVVERDKVAMHYRSRGWEKYRTWKRTDLDKTSGHVSVVVSFNPFEPVYKNGIRCLPIR